MVRLVREHKCARTRDRAPDGVRSVRSRPKPSRASVAPSRAGVSPSDTHPRTPRDETRCTAMRERSGVTYQLRASLLVLRRAHDESRRFASAVDASACLGLQKHTSHESRTVVSHHTRLPLQPRLLRRTPSFLGVPHPPRSRAVDDADDDDDARGRPTPVDAPVDASSRGG
jgi:hypothetical protein